MSAEDKDTAPNKKVVADAGALASAPLLGSNIMDEEGEDPKDNPLATVVGGGSGGLQGGHPKREGHR